MPIMALVHRQRQQDLDACLRDTHSLVVSAPMTIGRSGRR
jgi:hypothetical protein